MSDIDDELSEAEVLKILENDPLTIYAKAHQADYQKEIKRKNKKHSEPEKKFVKELLVFLRAEGFFVQVYESKWSRSRIDDSGNYLPSGAKKGTPDILGCDKNGTMSAIEAKAPGQRRASTLREEQRVFLMKSIRNQAFAVCTDSVEHFSSVYFKWLTLTTAEEKQDFLISSLP